MLHAFPLAALVSASVPAVGLPPPAVIPTGQPVSLAARRVPERPTVFVFYKPTSTLEASFLAALRRAAGEKVGFGVIRLTTGAEPIARQYEIRSTPTAIVYDRRGRMVTRSADAAAIEAAIRKAAGVMRIDWAEEGDPRLEELVRIRGGKRPVPGIMRTMSLKPEYMAAINEAAQKAHFADGYLKRRTKEMIATYVSSLNHCKY
jgi:hypothetical protein